MCFYSCVNSPFSIFCLPALERGWVCVLKGAPAGSLPAEAVCSSELSAIRADETRDAKVMSKRQCFSLSYLQFHYSNEVSRLTKHFAINTILRGFLSCFWLCYSYKCPWVRLPGARGEISKDSFFFGVVCIFIGITQPCILIPARECYGTCFTLKQE